MVLCVLRGSPPEIGKTVISRGESAVDFYLFDIVGFAILKSAIYWSAFLGRKNMPGPIPSGYGVVPSAVMETFIGTVSEGE
jgi:hypothetical protein